MKTATRVISLTTAQERRETFTKHATNVGVEWSFFDAHTELNSELDYNEDILIGRRVQPLTRGERGCYSSHFTLWREFLETDCDQLLVLEDDVQVDWPYLKKVIVNDFAKDGINYVRLYSLALPPCFNKGEYLGRYLYQFVGYALGTQAYVLTRKGVIALLKYCRQVKGPIDIVIDQSWRGSVASYALYPYPVMDRAVPSMIGQARTNMLLKQAEWSASLKIRRLLFRVDDAIRRRVFRILTGAGFGARVNADTRWV